jgi:hypothetical protein
MRMTALVYILTGIAWSLIFADAHLTLHGLSSGKLIEKNRIMRWFVKSPWRLYPVTAIACAGVYFVANLLTVWAGWPWGAALCLPLIIQRAIVVGRNYQLNVKVL